MISLARCAEYGTRDQRGHVRHDPFMEAHREREVTPHTHTHTGYICHTFLHTGPLSR